MSTQELERLVRKYYGYVADLEGSDVEAFDLLFTRDRIQRLLGQSTPDDYIPAELCGRVHLLDEMLWRERRTFLAVVGERELQHARKQQRSPRSRWWWYLDELKLQPQEGIEEQRLRLVQALAPAV